MVLVYLPTKLGHYWGFYVGQYTSTMEHMGIDIHFSRPGHVMILELSSTSRLHGGAIVLVGPGGVYTFGKAFFQQNNGKIMGL